MDERQMGLPPPLGIGDLVRAARVGDRLSVRRILDENPNSEDFLSLAEATLWSKIPSQRALATEIFESTSVELHPAMLDTLGLVSADKADDPSFLEARYYAALTLNKHGRLSADARSIIEETSRSDDVELAKDAKARLAQIKEMEGQEHEQNPES